MSQLSKTRSDRFAIIGIGCRLPGGANDHRAFWKNLVEGKSCIIETPASRDELDPEFFGFSPSEAESMDPQQWKMLEVTWEALEDAGQVPAELAGKNVGVFVGASAGTMMTMVSNRISYCFDFRGPSMSIDTACSSSLVAVHLACQSLARGESCLAVAGGVLEGVGVVVIKRLGNALRDGDPIHAVIHGTSVDQGGRETNIGPTEPAAGVAELIKTALSLKHQQIPTRLTAWPKHAGPARAGVSSFGFGGTNSHVLLEASPSNHRFPASQQRPGCKILPLTARDPSAFPAMAAALLDELEGKHGPAPELNDVGYTLARRRQHLEARLSFIYSSPAELSALLASFLAGEASPRIIAGTRLAEPRRHLAWVFTGMGPQWWAMGRELFAKEPIYREVIERCDREIAKLAGWSLIEEMGAEKDTSNMTQTWLAQPANFAVQVGLAALWRSLGVRPEAIVGHGTGEVAALYEAGIYSFEDAIKITVHRSRLQQQLVGTGAMLAVGLSEREAEARIGHVADRVAIAAINSPTAVTLSGDADTLRELCAQLQAEQVFAKLLNVPVPYHSPAMDRIKDELLASLADLDPRPARLPLYLAAVEGAAQGAELDAAYWWKNVRGTVRFRAAIERMSDDGITLFLEVGPHPVLGNAIVECLEAKGREGKTLPSIRRQEGEQAQLMISLATLHNAGVEIAWKSLYASGLPLPLPRYPWKRDRYWIASAAVEPVRMGQLDHELHAAAAAPDVSDAFDVSDVFEVSDISDAAAAARYAGLAELAGSAQEAEGADQPAAEVELHTDETCYPLTQNQKALWFLKQLDPDGFAYNIGGAVEVEAALEPERMFEAVRILIQRHPMLRANFLLENGRPVQRISPEITPDLRLIDVQGESWDSIYQAIIREYRKPYDLERDPLLRFRMFQRSDRRFILMKAVHHIISDAISTFTFIEELLAVYDALRRGEAPTLPPVGARYLDFLNWQNKLLTSRDAARMRQYWMSHLPAEVPVLNLPTDKPRPIVQTHNGASQLFTLDSELTAKLHRLSQETGATLFTILLSAYYLLLHRYSAQDEIIVGSPVTGRTADELSSVYGYFVNPLPLCASMKGDPSFLEFLAQVRTIVMNGLDNQEYPFVLLVEQLGLKHDPSRSAVFQAMFILLVHRVATEQYGFKLSYIELPEEEGQFDLTLSAYEDQTEASFHCVLKYNSDLFRAETIQRMASHYTALLASLTAAPKRRLSEHRMLGQAERARILERWSGVQHPAFPGLPVHVRISWNAAAQPDELAVSLPDERGAVRTMTYGELEIRSNQLARHLRSLGAIEEDVVAVCLEKSPGLVASLLAIWKAGAAYLPIDPAYPDDRLAHMVQSAEARFLICDEATARRWARLPGATRGATLVVIDEALELVADRDPGPLAVPSELDRSAYVIYTSGSSGRPKGVRVTHRSLASAYQAWETAYRLRTDVRVHLQTASFSFDVFTGDLVRALCSGAALCLVRRELLLNTARLYEIMLRHRVDVAELVPSLARGLTAYCQRQGKRLAFLRLLVVGSDAWKVAEHRQLRALLGPRTRLINSYGLTEATIDSTYFEGALDDLEPGQMVPIGVPFSGSSVFLLDGDGAPVPAGVPGELWVGGGGVAAGYVGEPEQTAARFKTVTLDDSGPMRLYRTGDLARWDAHGRIHLCGRADGQVKVRGHRIETAEIEHQLVQLDDVAQAVVMVRPDAAGEMVLCAYCIGAPGVALDGRAVREHLSTQLPTFMIPTHILQVAELPLSPNGKVDLGGLPLPERLCEGGGGEPPRTHYELRMAEHWKQLLGVADVGLEHDFFELGGSSIKLVELVYQLQAELDLAISVSQLFKVSTLAGMARAVEDAALGRDTIARSIRAGASGERAA